MAASRIVPPGVARYGSFLSEGVILMLGGLSASLAAQPAARSIASRGSRWRVPAMAAGGLLANDGDADADVISLTGFTGAGGAGKIGSALAGAWRNLVLNADGSFSYTPDATKLAVAPAFDMPVDNFVYTINDGHGGTASAELAISVTPTGIVT